VLGNSSASIIREVPNQSSSSIRLPVGGDAAALLSAEHRRIPLGGASFSERDYIGLLDAAHQQFGGPIVPVWDNLNTHVSAAMRAMIAARDWLHVIITNRLKSIQRAPT
jgi:hypothetical protein